MSRRSLLGAVGIVALLFASMGTGLVLLLRVEPRHHNQAAVPAGEVRTGLSRTFFREFTSLLSAVGSQDKWAQKFTDEEINSFLSEGFVQMGLAEKLLPKEISEPHVTFEQDRMWLSFRYHNKVLSTVVSVALRIWLPRSEPNVVALRIEGIHAGAVPFKAQWLLERISEVAAQNDVNVSWYRHEGSPVAIVRFQPNQARPTLRLKAVRFEPGKITIHGESGERTRTAMNGTGSSGVN
jgi:hypothetical protein